MIKLLAERPFLYGFLLTGLGVLGLVFTFGVRALIVSGMCLLLGVGGILFGAYDALWWRMHWRKLERERVNPKSSR